MANEHIKLSDNSVLDLSDVPAQFVQIVPVKRLSKLVRNCETVYIDCPTIGLVKAQKGGFMEAIDACEDAVQFVAVFDGLILNVYGVLGDDDSDPRPDSDWTPN